MPASSTLIRADTQSAAGSSSTLSSSSGARSLAMREVRVHVTGTDGKDASGARVVVKIGGAIGPCSFEISGDTDANGVFATVYDAGLCGYIGGGWSAHATKLLDAGDAGGLTSDFSVHTELQLVANKRVADAAKSLTFWLFLGAAIVVLALVIWYFRRDVKALVVAR